MNLTGAAACSVGLPRWCTAGQAILEPVHHPGFLEFNDDVTHALLLSATGQQYKVYCLRQPGCPLLYCFPAAGVVDVKLGGTHLVLLHGAEPRRLARRGERRPPPALEQVTAAGWRSEDVSAVVPLELRSASSGQARRLCVWGLGRWGWGGGSRVQGRERGGGVRQKGACVASR